MMDEINQAPQKTLRDEFAAAAMSGLLSDHAQVPSRGQTFAEFAQEVANAAYKYADAMLDRRER